MGYWENTTYVHCGDPAAVARALTSLFGREGMTPVEAPPRRERQGFEPMQYEDALGNDLWAVAVFPGAPSWTLLKTAPSEILGERRPGMDRIRLAELCSDLAASAVQINVYDSLGPILAEASPEGRVYLSGFGYFKGDGLTWRQERLAEELIEARLRIHSVAEVRQGMPAEDMAAALARRLGGPNADCSENGVSVQTLVCHEPLPGTGGTALYFRWPGPSRVRIPPSPGEARRARAGK